MTRVRAIVAELAGLFVEDRAFALAIAVWIAICLGAAAAHVLAPVACGVALFAGLATVLVASVVSAARRR